MYVDPNIAWELPLWTALVAASCWAHWWAGKLLNKKDPDRFRFSFSPFSLMRLEYFVGYGLFRDLGDPQLTKKLRWFEIPMLLASLFGTCLVGYIVFMLIGAFACSPFIR